MATGQVDVYLRMPGYEETSIRLDREVSYETERTLARLPRPKPEGGKPALPRKPPTPPPAKKPPGKPPVNFEFEP